MKKINIVFEDDLEDVDVLLVPEYIANDIERITQNFFDWVSAVKHQKLFEQKSTCGNTHIAVGTHAFVWWLNEYTTQNGDVVVILKEHTTYCPEYPTAAF